MNRTWGLALLTAGVLACACDGLPSLAQDKKDDKPTVVEIDGMKAPVPAEWKRVAKPKSTFRAYEFILPKAKDDKVDGEMFITKGIGGRPDENIKRWKEMFTPPEGKTIDDVSKQSEIKIGDKKATFFEVYGTYKYKFPPQDPKAKLELRPDHRMLNVQYEGTEDTYHIRFVGPAATIDTYRKGFEDWLKALKK